LSKQIKYKKLLSFRDVSLYATKFKKSIEKLNFLKQKLFAKNSDVTFRLNPKALLPRKVAEAFCSAIF
jgi:hypothetical protein